MKKWLILLMTLGIALAVGFWALNPPDQEGVPEKQGAFSQEELPKGEAEAETQAPVVGIRNGNLAPDFTLENLAGEKVSLSDFRGQRVLLNFWSTQCVVCKEEMPILNEFHLKMQEENLVVLGVSLGDPKEKVQGVMEEHGYQFPVLLDSDLEVTYQYSILYMPTTFFINEEGIIEGMKIGGLTLEELNQIYKVK